MQRNNTTYPLSRHVALSMTAVLTVPYLIQNQSSFLLRGTSSLKAVQINAMITCAMRAEQSGSQVVDWLHGYQARKGSIGHHHEGT